MSRKDFLAVRFHFDGKFVNEGRTLQYVGGEDAISMIPLEGCGIAEIHRHLRRHHNTLDREMLHWLMPGKSLFDGLSCLQLIVTLFVNLVMLLCRHMSNVGLSNKISR